MRYNTKKKVSKKQNLENELLFQIKAVGLPIPRREYRFHPVRKWRSDFAYIKIKLLIEVEGGTWIKGRHTTGSGYRNDCIKYNEAAILGWAVLRVTSDMIKSGQALEQIERMMSAKGIKLK